MTDLSLSHTTHTAPLDHSTVESTPTLHFTQDIPTNGVATEENEEYTIKCRCDNPEDDRPGTVLCEKCDTWQHIQCYYDEEPVPDIHECVDCRPREIATKLVTDRLKRKREHPDTDRKTKKPATKSHKKKIKVLEQPAGANGRLNDKIDISHARNGANTKETVPPSTKKAKNNHRASNSVQSHAPPLYPPSHSAKRSVSASYPLQSPSKSPCNVTPNGYHSEQFTIEFLQLYDNDPGDAPMQANFFNDIGITACLASWSKDIEALTQATKGKKPQDIFHRCEQPLDSMSFPQLNKVCKEDSSVDFDGLRPRWTYLTIDSFTPQNTIVSELRGKIGHMSKYVEDPANRWDYLRHPLPFVFFHDQLPIYIDTRQEGSSCRYLRRSCRPNLSMKTFLENGSEYHFCFVSNQDLDAGTELTIGWRLDEHISKFVQPTENGIKDEVNAETAGSYVVEWVGKVLADFGGCACNDPSGCLMASYDRRASMFSDDSAISMSNGNTKKGRHASSHSTGYAANSRSGSEAFKHQNGDEHDDYRSSSGSAPHSRDMTPSKTMTCGKETPATMDREKRKIAQEEQIFKKLEEVDNKKRRQAGGSNVNTPNPGTSKQLGHFATLHSQPTTPGVASHSHPPDPTASRTQSVSPTTKTSSGVPLPTDPRPKTVSSRSHLAFASRTMPVRLKYIDSSTQTDMTSEDEMDCQGSSKTSTRQPFISLTKQLLMRCYKHRLQRDAAREASLKGTSTEKSNVNTHMMDVSTTSSLPTAVRKPLQEDADTEMQDIHDPVTTPVDSPPNPAVEKHRPPDEIPKVENDHTNDSPFKPPPPPKPWALNHSSSFHRKEAINGYRSADLRVQLPPKETFTNDSASTPSTISTLTPLPNTMTQSPLSTTSGNYPPSLTPSSSSSTQPTTVKKKLTLGDYITRRSSNKVETLSTVLEDKQQVGSSPTSHDAAPSLSSLPEETKDQPIEGSTILETPKAGTSISPTEAMNSEKMDSQDF